MNPIVSQSVNQSVLSVYQQWISPALNRLIGKAYYGFEKNIEPLGKHFSQYLERTYSTYSTINTLAFRNQQKQLRDLYVPLTLIDDRVVNDSNPFSVKVDSYPKDLMNRYNRVLIMDNAGMGKSTLTKVMFLSAIDENVGIPIYVELRKLTKGHKLLDEIRERLDSLSEEFDERLMLELFQLGGFIFFFDGFDEIALAERPAVTNDLKSFIEKAHNDNSFVLTSRYEQALAGFGDFFAMRIRPLKKDEAYSLLRKYDSNGGTSEALIRKLELSNYRSIFEFLENPLLVSLLFVGFNYKPDIPLKIHLFYDQVFEALFNSHDLSKDGSYVHEKESGLDMADFGRFLRALGFVCFKKNQLGFERNDFLEAIKLSKKISSIQTCSDKSLMSDLLHSVPLFCQDGLQYKWIHKAMQEYFAADFINRDSGEKKDSIVTSIVSSQNSNNSLNMLYLYSDLDLKGFQRTVILPFLSEYLSFIEKPIKSSSINTETILNRRQFLYFGDYYVYVFDKIVNQLESNEVRQLFATFRSLVPSSPCQLSIRHASKYHIGLAYYPNFREGLKDIILRKIPDTTLHPSAKPKFSSSFLYNTIYHIEDAQMSDFPDVYEDLNVCLEMSFIRVFDYRKVKLKVSEIQRSLLDNDDALTELLSS